MRQIVLAIRAERMKLRRFKNFYWSLFGLFVFIPLLIGLMMYVAQHPEMSAKLGLVGAKALVFFGKFLEGLFGNNQSADCCTRSDWIWIYNELGFWTRIH